MSLIKAEVRHAGYKDAAAIARVLAEAGVAVGVTEYYGTHHGGAVRPMASTWGHRFQPHIKKLLDRATTLGRFKPKSRSDPAHFNLTNAGKVVGCSIEVQTWTVETFIQNAELARADAVRQASLKVAWLERTLAAVRGTDVEKEADMPDE